MGERQRASLADRTKRWQEGLIAERDEMHKNVDSTDQREAMAAAVEKRPPVFTG